ncbi:DUF1501 domain-containing protein, partial [Gordonia sp. UBA7599]|uniref:DUF1501 domain-containing protein n=1 Tax=Gordonia sp. UBA7599 TaxID=1946578 RepID=UPI0039C87DBC
MRQRRWRQRSRRLPEDSGQCGRGGGVRGGTVYGATDEFGFKAVDKPVHVHDL